MHQESHPPVSASARPFFILRHGVTDYNQRRIVMGHLDIPLNDRGRCQARDIADHVAALGITRLVSSPLSRARETAEIISERLGLSFTTHDGLKERDWGQLTGHSYNELAHWRGDPPLGAETGETFARRVVVAMNDIEPDRNTLLVAHSGVCRLLRRHFQIPDDHHPIPNAVPILFSSDKDGIWTTVTMGKKSGA